MKQDFCGFGGDFVLNDDVGLELLAILRAEVFCKSSCQTAMQSQQRRAFEGVRDAFAEGSKADDIQGERLTPSRSGSYLFDHTHVFR